MLIVSWAPLTHNKMSGEVFLFPFALSARHSLGEDWELVEDTMLNVKKKP
jgi:hypothetical protein